MAASGIQYRLRRGGQPAPANQSFGDRIFVASREGDHFDIWEHAVFDVDRRNVACVIGVDEEDAAAVPEVLAVFFAGFDVQFQSLSSHCLILTLSVSMNMTKAGTKGMSAGKLPREECAGAGEFSC
ncbi:hypothetical protein RC74_09925 [Falsihalocynthiibacter arcticus]|uniref:Uncharacterized protein n=1 Tax=Falsihalocynthiibacter arcticus TaxID=1579316 RepID=A0A126V0Q3_9RHOB|nr:hypothetical protein RC74_09925 [Falsihalocynthiibacter arcticus]